MDCCVIVRRLVLESIRNAWTQNTEEIRSAKFGERPTVKYLATEKAFDFTRHETAWSPENGKLVG